MKHYSNKQAHHQTAAAFRNNTSNTHTHTHTSRC